MESPVFSSHPPQNNSLSNHHQNGRCYPETGQQEDQDLHGTNELIINLDHKLWDVRLRALKCILGKLECSIVTTKSLSQRVELLNRLFEWLRTASEVNSKQKNDGTTSVNSQLVAQGVPIVIQLLLRLSEHEEARKYILKEKVDCLLTNIRLQLSLETRDLLDRLVESVYTKSFNIEYTGAPDLWDDNASRQSIRDNSKSSENFSLIEKYNQVGEMERGEGDSAVKLQDKVLSQSKQSDTPEMSVRDTFFPHQSINSSVDKSWASGFKFEIPTVQLSATDRRVLSSTIESLLSKNEGLVFMTSCFIRDVLVQDYPPEVFIQESALSMGFLEVAESSWIDPRIQYTSVQGLLKISHQLRCRINQLNSSEFYEVTSAPNINMPSYFNGSSSFSTQYGKNSFSIASDMFVENLCQLLKSLSRTLLFKSEELCLWKLFDSFSLTLYKCVNTFPMDSKTLSLKLQDILLDLAYCYQKNSDYLNPACLALCLSTVLRSLYILDENFILTNDIRMFLRSFLRSPQLFNDWPEVYQYFLSVSTNFGFDDALQDGQSPQNESQPREIIVNLLFDVQNATGHKSVSQVVENLWNFLLPLVLNTRVSDDLLDYICKEAPWRDSFFRFLSVEPTCIEDEELLIQVVDLLAFVIMNMREGVKALTDWVIPLCMEKACAGLRLLNEHSSKADTPYAGTMLPSILRSLFDFYESVTRKILSTIESEYLWNVFSTYCLILHELGENAFVFTAVLRPVLQGIASFTSFPSIKLQLKKSMTFCVALINRVTSAIISLQEGNGGVSSDSYRSQGALYNGSLALLHLSQILCEDKSNLNATHNWMGRCCAVIPCLWDSRDMKVRALGFQLCEVITRTNKGAVFAMTILGSPSVVWTSAYSTLMDFEEAALVKHKAACVLLNLLELWSEVQNSGVLKESLQLPNWATIDDFTKLLSHVYWLPSLSEVFRVAENESVNDDAASSKQLVTPKVLATLCKLLIKMKSSSIQQFHPAPFPQVICSSGLCPVLFRLIGTNPVSLDLNPSWWFDCCSALSCMVEALISMCQLDCSVSVILIGDKRSLGSLIQLFLLEPLPGQHREQAIAVLSCLWVNIFTLLTVLCADSGNNFEDLEKCVWSERNIIFNRIVCWLKQDTLVKCRQISLTFLHAVLSRLSLKQNEGDNSINGSSLNGEARHPYLCKEWREKSTSYGSALCQSLVELYGDVVNPEDKQQVLKTLTALIRLSPSAKSYAIEKDLIGLLIEELRKFALQYHDAGEASQVGRKSVNQRHEETVCILSVLSSLVYRDLSAKKSALFNGMVDAFHKIFKWWKSYPDRTMLHSFMETLMNFTEEFPSGSQALTVTTSILGVGPRKAPTPQSFLFEIVGILQNELELMEKGCNIKTIEFIFEFLKNVVFVVECRNLLMKSSILTFLTKLHVREMKKWGAKQHHIKVLYLEFLVHLTVHPDMQSAIAKVPEAIEILILLVDLEDSASSSLALKIIRNLSFQAGNRARFLCDDGLMPTLSAIIRDSDNLDEIESAAVGLWALISNSEKGKLSAKKAFCNISVSKAITRLQKLEDSSNDLQTEKRDFSNLINVLTTVSNILGSTQVGSC